MFKHLNVDIRIAKLAELVESMRFGLCEMTGFFVQMLRWVIDFFIVPHQYKCTGYLNLIS